MKDNKIDISNFSDFQKQTILKLIQCCEKDSINFDKFILSILKNPGTSIILNMLNNIDIERKINEYYRGT